MASFLFAEASGKVVQCRKWHKADIMYILLAFCSSILVLSASDITGAIFCIKEDICIRKKVGAHILSSSGVHMTLLLPRVYGRLCATFNIAWLL